MTELFRDASTAHALVDHLINEDAGRKVFSIDKMEDGPELVIRLVTQGRRQASPTGLYGKISGSERARAHALARGHPGRVEGQGIPQRVRARRKAAVGMDATSSTAPAYRTPRAPPDLGRFQLPT